MIESIMPSLSEAYRAHPVYLHHKNPDFHSLRELPDSYAWTHLDDNRTAAVDADGGGRGVPPVIDLDDPNAPTLIGHACRSWGVFQVVNHGVPSRLLQDIESTGKSLFSLPPHQKLKAARSPDGVSGYGLARISSFFPKLMWSEGFTILGSPLDHFRQLWPLDYTKYCNVVVEYEEAMEKLAGKLTWLVLASLGISNQDIQWAGSKDEELKGACAALQFNSYPTCPDPDRAMGLAAHTDSTILTILYQNAISGLQVFKEGTGWVTVPPIPGGLVINVGDLLHILSNGLYPSVLHRVLVNRTRQRLSAAYLHGPPASVKISPHPKVVGPNRPPLYRPVTWHEYLGTKAKHFNEALSFVRLCAPKNAVFGDGNDTDHGHKNNNSVQVG
ncbi:gibberellin 3-beta-dioxygenase 1-like [Neltuma alba]|uniref:gibberellin 3-beta-dioxygenase 1-like n=1 Tax=Neltuma alba TaxID=207710 RepID=UPI0010A50D21|nr:gibberellin 3-beta-dioxygenase 1-like [Prosopis alba]